MYGTRALVLLAMTAAAVALGMAWLGSRCFRATTSGAIRLLICKTLACYAGVFGAAVITSLSALAVGVLFVSTEPFGPVRLWHSAQHLSPLAPLAFVPSLLSWRARKSDLVDAGKGKGRGHAMYGQIEAELLFDGIHGCLLGPVRWDGDRRGHRRPRRLKSLAAALPAAHDQRSRAPLHFQIWLRSALQHDAERVGLVGNDHTLAGFGHDLRCIVQRQRGQPRTSFYLFVMPPWHVVCSRSRRETTDRGRTD
jgi:hypothetical protein